MADPDTLPTASDLAGPCPRCGRVANFKLVHSEQLRFLGDRWTGRSGSGASAPATRPVEGRTVEQVSVISCMGCGEKSVVIEAEINDQYGMQGVSWWPTDHLAGLQQAAGLPQEIVEAYSEGVRCLGVQSPNAAAAMFRTTIAQIVQDKGSEAAKKAGTLDKAIKQMVADRALFEDFGDWAHHIRTTGNAGAHGEAFDPVTQEQAAELKVFIRELINFLYVQPARRAAARPATRKAAPPVAGTTQS